jgi:type IV pilus assembly protein PilC
MNNCFSRPLGRSALGRLARHCAVAFAEKRPIQRPLPERLESLSKQEADKKLGDVLSLIAAELQKGSTFAGALQKQASRLGFFFCRIAALGETAGIRGPLLARLADFYEKDDRFDKKIHRTLRYPAVVLFVTTAAIAAVLAFFVPAAARSLSGYTGILPAATKITLGIIAFISLHRQSVFLIVLLVCGFCACLPCLYVRLPWLEKISWTIPVFGNLCRDKSLRGMASGISFLLSIDLAPSETLTIMAETAPTALLRHKLLRAAQKKPGNTESLTAALKTHEVFPAGILDMLPDAKEPLLEGEPFEKMAGFYEEEILAAVNAIVMVIEPLIVAVSGLLGGGILLALYLPVLRTFGSH